MKKLATTFGLLALLLVVTSFTTPNEIGGGKGRNGQGTSQGGDFTYETGGRDGKGTSQGGDFTYEIGGRDGKGTSQGGDFTYEIGGRDGKGTSQGGD